MVGDLMELITLNEDNQGAKTLENWDSLIWTERFSTTGGFQLVTGLVDEYMDLMPEGKVVSLRESSVPMITETHLIERKKGQGAKLTITGRSFESILDRRIALNGMSLAEWAVVAKTPMDAAYYIIHKIVVEGILDPADIFPSDVVQFISPPNYMTGPGPNRQFTIPRGNLLSAVLGLIQTQMAADPTTVPATPAMPLTGIRSVRPNSAGTAVGVQFYQGQDKSATVRFDGTRDLLDDGRYLFSKVGSGNAAYVFGGAATAKMHTGATQPTGLDRRVMLVDNATGTTDSIRQQGSKALSAASKTALFDGSINEDLSPYIYGVDISLGDIVTLVGDYGQSTKVRMTEYIRSQDATGRKSYPTFAAI